VDGKTFRQPLVVTMDPRVKTSASDLQAQLDLALAMDLWMDVTFKGYNELAQLKAAIDDRQKFFVFPLMTTLSESLNAVKADLPAIAEGTSATPGFGAINRDLARYVQMIQTGDARPAKSAADSAMVLCRALADDMQRWRQVNESRLPQLNQELQKHNLAALPVVHVSQPPVCSN
jgi:hypothetical protein